MSGKGIRGEKQTLSGFLHRTQFKKPIFINSSSLWPKLLDENEEAMIIFRDEFAENIDTILRNSKVKRFYLIPGSFGELEFYSIILNIDYKSFLVQE